MNNKTYNKKVLKYGTASVILAVVFIALVFTVNLVSGILTERFNLYVDLTSEQLYSISDATHTLLEDMKDEEVKIIFFTPLDQLDSNSYVKNIKTLALEYEEQFPNLTIEYIDMTRNPELVRKYRKDYQLSETTVIVESAKRFTCFDMSECFVYTQNDSGAYSYYAFNGEYRFTSSLLKVTRDTMPVVTFVTNHGETTPAIFKSIFTDSGFEVTTVDLLQEEIDPSCEILIMVDPQTDLTGTESEEEGRSEITKLTAYLNSGKDMMVFMDPETPELENLDSLLYTWGIDVLHGVSVQDNVNYVSSANKMALLAEYISTDETVTALHSKLSKVTSPMRPVSYYTAPVIMVPLTNVSRGVAAVLSSSSSGFVPKNANENYFENVRVPVMAAAYQREFDKELQETVVNYLVVGGSTYFVSDQYLGAYSNLFGNSELIKNMISTMTDEKIVLDIQYKVYDDTSMVVPAEDSNQWLIFLVTALPAMVLVVAVAVFLKRRHL